MSSTLSSLFSGLGETVGAVTSKATGGSGGEETRRPADGSNSVHPRFQVATVPEKQLVSFLRELGVPGACILGSPQWLTQEELEGVTLYYIMTSSAVHSLCLTERWGGLADWMDRPNDYEATLHPSLRNQDWSLSRLADICLNDVPAIQTFLISILTDPNFFHRKDAYESSSSITSSPSGSSKDRVSMHSKRLLNRDHLTGKPYAVVLEADALHLIVPRLDQQPKKYSQILPEPAATLGSSPSPTKTEATAYDVYVLRPCFSATQRLICTVTYVQSELSETRWRLKGKEEAVSLPCTITDIINVIRSVMEARSGGVLSLFNCLRSVQRRSSRNQMLSSSEEAAPGAPTAGGNGDIQCSSHLAEHSSMDKDARRKSSNTLAISRSHNRSTGPGNECFSRHANSLKAMELITLSRLLGSQMFCRLLWQKMIGACDPVNLSLLRSTVFPVELSLATAMTSSGPSEILDPSIFIAVLQNLLSVPQGSRPRGFKNDNFKHLCLALLEVISTHTSHETLIKSAIRVIHDVPAIHQACVENRAINSTIRMYHQARGIRNEGLARRLASLSPRHIDPRDDFNYGSQLKFAGCARDMEEHLFKFFVAFELPEEDNDLGVDSDKDDDDGIDIDDADISGSGQCPRNDLPKKDDARLENSGSIRSPQARADGSQGSSRGSSALSRADSTQRILKAKMSFGSKMQRTGSARKIVTSSPAAAMSRHEPTMAERRQGSSHEDIMIPHVDHRRKKEGPGDECDAGPVEALAAIDRPAKKAQSMGLFRVPKLTITPALEIEKGIGALNTGGGTGSSRRGHSSSSSATPYTTRSSRRYFAAKGPSTNTQVCRL